MDKPNILIVEDNFLIALDIQELLTSAGFHITDTVASGEEAIKKTLELKPDLILMDIGLKGSMDGIEAVNRIRDHRNIPVIFLTGNSDQLRRRNIKDPYISKPFTTEELQELINSLLEHSV
ncbi:MAG: response regulator [Balneolales bacterium]